MAALGGLTRAGLRARIALFAVALVVPAAILVAEAFGQLRWEAFHRHRLQAEELATRIDERLGQWIDVEEARGFAEYAFLTVEGGNFVQRSPLSRFPVDAETPGLVGYFQVDAAGRLSTPLLPPAGVPVETYGVSARERVARAELARNIELILAENRLLGRAVPVEHPVEHAVEYPAEGPVGGPVGDAPPTLASAPLALELEESEAPGEGSGVENEAADSDAPAGEIPDSRALGDAALESRTPEGGTLESRTRVSKTLASRASESSLPESKASRKKVLEKVVTPAPAPSAADAGVAPTSDPAPDTAADLAPDLAGSQRAFDELSNAPAAPGAQTSGASLGRVEDIELDVGYAARQQVEAKDAVRKKSEEARTTRLAKRRVARKEQAVLAEPESVAAPGRLDDAVTGSASRDVRIRAFESELDPFELSLLGSGHFVVYRKVWREGQRFIQGALVDRQKVIEEVIGEAFRATALANASNLAIGWRGEVLAAFGGGARGRYFSSADELAGALLYRTRLSAPFGPLELVFTVTRLEAGPGASVVIWTALALGVVLVVGLTLMYRTGARQIDLARQQQDFVSAVSHELRTPLTSIRMYGEMLREGWVGDEKRQGYYAYIVDESERLTRLISNVLQLARMTRNEMVLDTAPIAVSELLDGVRSKVASAVERAGFELVIDCPDEIGGERIVVDADAFSQCLINLIDNALKFAAKAERKSVVVSAARTGSDRIRITVRDFGPGVPRDQIVKIFRLFYRPEGELTRETVGTGIGLALVRQLAEGMEATVDVDNASPGAAFSLEFPVAT